MERPSQNILVQYNLIIFKKDAYNIFNPRIVKTVYIILLGYTNIVW